jgi:hypothetical protein
MECTHQRFVCHANVNRLEDTPGGDITGFSADITIQCADCEIPFRFLGLPGGLLADGAAVSVDGTEARLAITPATGEPIHSVRGFILH